MLCDVSALQFGASIVSGCCDGDVGNRQAVAMASAYDVLRERQLRERQLAMLLLFFVMIIRVATNGFEIGSSNEWP